MLSDERRKQIEEEERLKVEEERYREEVRYRMGAAANAPKVKLPEIPFSGPTEPESTSGSHVWKAIIVVALILAGAYWLFSESGTKPTPKPGTSQAAAPFFRPPVRIPVSQPIASGQVVIPPGGHVSYRIRIVPGMENVRVT